MTSAAPRVLTILGATGSIGVNTVAVAQALGVRVHAVSAHRKVDELARIAVAGQASVAVIADESLLPQLRRALSGSAVQAQAGPEALCAVSSHPQVDTVMTAIVGAAGLPATLAAVRAGKRVCIANKEPLVMAGELIVREAMASGAELLPVDSEHSAIFQCLEHHHPDEVAQLILTASGGPFRQVQDLAQVTREQALKHPTWSMGPKITIDSATLMNKSLEIIEARWLFGIAAARIRVLIHPQSVIHSMVTYRDGSVMAQLGRPDMRVPIQYSLTYPRHAPGPVPAPDFASLGALTFEEPDLNRFPSLRMGFHAATQGGLLPTVMNAANEMAVADYLAGHGRFIDIFQVIERALAQAPRVAAPSLDEILAADGDTRAQLSVR